MTTYHNYVSTDLLNLKFPKLKSDCYNAEKVIDDNFWLPI